jgi:hypothetical protein
MVCGNECVLLSRKEVGKSSCCSLYPKLLTGMPCLSWKIAIEEFHLQGVLNVRPSPCKLTGHSCSCFEDCYCFWYQIVSPSLSYLICLHIIANPWLHLAKNNNFFCISSTCLRISNLLPMVIEAFDCFFALSKDMIVAACL